MYGLHVPDRVHHVEEHGDRESDEEHEDGDRRFEVVDRAVKYDFMGGKSGGSGKQAHGAPNDKISCVVDCRSFTNHARAMLGIENKIDDAKRCDFSSLISCGMSISAVMTREL
jgi:hypothetical protein